jgi:hypothetical protein
MIEPGPYRKNFECTACDTATFATNATKSGRATPAKGKKRPVVANVADVASPTLKKRERKRRAASGARSRTGGVMSAPEVAPERGQVRRRLANRCEHELMVAYTAGCGRFDDGGLAEIFLATAKHGTGLVAVRVARPKHSGGL